MGTEFNPEAFPLYGATSTEGVTWSYSEASLDLTSIHGNTADDSLKITTTDKGTRSTTAYGRSFYINHTIHADAALTGTAEVNGMGIDLTISDPCPYIYPISIYTGTVSNKAITQMAAINIYMEDVGNACQHAQGIYVSRNITNVGTASDSFLWLRNHGSTAATAFIKATGKATHLFDFQDGDQCVPVSAGSDSTNVSHKVSVKMADGSTRYFHLFTD